MAATVSLSQLKILIDYLEEHTELALGRCTRSKEGRSLSKRLWVECATLLNSVSADCSQKTPEQWRVYYNEYKSKLLKKIKKEKNEKSATGGGQAANIQLTPLQERLYIILGRDVGEPVSGVRHNPLINISQGDVSVGTPEAESYNSFGDPRLGPNFNFLIDDREIDDVAIEGILQEDRQEEVEPGISILLEQEKKDILNYKNNKKEKEKEKKKKQIKKKKEKENKELEEEPTMREAAAALRRMEQLNADAMLVHANAINRLAAAIELLANRLPVAPVMPISSPARARHRRVLIESSESDME